MLAPEDCYKALKLSAGFEPKPFDTLPLPDKQYWIRFAHYLNSLVGAEFTALNIYNAFNIASKLKKQQIEVVEMPKDIKPDWYQWLADYLNESQAGKDTTNDKD